MGDADVTIVSETRAYSTMVEFPAAIGVGIDTVDATLLAVQEWKKDAGDDGQGYLVQHQTIPWTDQG